MYRSVFLVKGHVFARGLQPGFRNRLLHTILMASRLIVPAPQLAAHTVLFPTGTLNAMNMMIGYSYGDQGSSARSGEVERGIVS